MYYKQSIEKLAQYITQKHEQCYPWLGDYTTDMETQLMLDTSRMVSRNVYLGEKGHKGWMIHHKGEWYYANDMRIPYRANTDSPSWPTANRPVVGPIIEHFHLFGTSGWNWAEKKSHFVGFDFDSLANHASGLTADQLREIKQRALSLGYVTARTSKSGEGIHLLVYFGAGARPTTRNHKEHALLAKDVLTRMSHDCDYDFQTGVDCFGSILWHWMKGMTDDGCKQISNFE